MFKIFEQIVLISILSSILATGILLIKSGFKQRLSARFHYYIWFVLVLRLIIPFNMESPLSILNLVPQRQPKVEVPYTNEESSSKITEGQVFQNDYKENIKIEEKKSRQAPAKGMKFNYEIAAWVWLFAAAAILLYIISVNLLLLLKVRKLETCTSQDIIDILEECRTRLKVKSKVTVVYDVNFKSPMLVGVFHPKILISSEIINKLSNEELKYIFLHELSHHKRKDLLVNIVCMLIQTVYWFNPVILYSVSQMKKDCEIACDATVLAVLSQEENKKYGHTIINMMKLLSKPQWVPGTLGFASKYNTRRIIMISKINKASVKCTAAAIIAISLLAGCSSLKAPANPQSSSLSPDNTSSTALPVPADATKNTSSSALTPQKEGETQEDDKSIVYKNAQYGFNFSLPISWKGYTIVTDKWNGVPPGKSLNDSGTVSGPLISIRHPRWTSKNQRQDIPILVFTKSQWNSLQHGEFFIGAAPIGPTELGHNSSFIFALPARYNYAFPEGYEEVEAILKKKPLSTADTNSDAMSADRYISFLGLSKEKLSSTLKETPVSIDEGGLSFEKAGIRVWFKDYGKGQVVSQVFTQRTDINFNGAVIGDNLSSFKKALGNPISDKNGDAHFKYKDIFLSFNYDTKTGNTVCVYFLKEDY